MTDEKNVIAEESKESDSQVQSAPNEPVKTEPQSTETKVSNSNIENEKKALQGMISAKDKQSIEDRKQMAEIKSELEKMKTQATLSKMLLKEEMPDKIKDILAEMVENGEVDLNNFESKKTKLSEIYNAGLESQKKTISEFVNKKPEVVMPESEVERLNKMTNFNDLEKFIAEKR